MYRYGILFYANFANKVIIVIIIIERHLTRPIGVISISIVYRRLTLQHKLIYEGTIVFLRK